MNEKQEDFNVYLLMVKLRLNNSKYIWEACFIMFAQILSGLKMEMSSDMFVNYKPMPQQIKSVIMSASKWIYVMVICYSSWGVSKTGFKDWR